MPGAVRPPSGEIKPVAPGDGTKRINAFLAVCLGKSRRACDELLSEGNVTVNGRPAEMNDRIGAEDDVRFEGRRLRLPGFVYLAFNKPRGVVTAVKDYRSKTVMDLLPPTFRGLFPVGRLDQDSRGLLIMTNDGTLAQRILHPRFRVPRVYRVRADRRVDLARLQKGVYLEDGFSKFDSVRSVSPDDCTIEVTLHEGKKRQIRRTFAALGHKVQDLIRISFGEVELGAIPEGGWRELTESEVKGAMKAAPVPRPQGS